MTSFTDLGLAAPLLEALDTEGYTTPTPIQLQAIPVVLGARDLVGIAQTGTGKTAAFALPILHRLAADRRAPLRKGCRALVLSPTRELASQIAESFRTYGRHMGLSVTVVFGGVGHRPQIQALARGVDVLVATPGRLLDHMASRVADISGTEILVLDEADQMLDLGFIKPIRRIVSALSSKRQTLLFSATMPDEIASLAREMLREPERVAVTPVAKTADRVAQRVIHVETSKKRALLTELLADPAMGRTLVFTRTKRGADRVARHLEVAGVAVAAIHGNKSQGQREKALEAFRVNEIRVLVATDIAARGIDIDGISHVVNFELPEVPEVYVHRIGRTARAGAEGSAITLCDREEIDLLRRIERLTRQSIAAESRLADAGLAADTTPAERGRRDRDRGRVGMRSRGGDRDERRGRNGDRGHERGGRGDRSERSPRRADDRPTRDWAPHDRSPRDERAEAPARDDYIGFGERPTRPSGEGERRRGGERNAAHAPRSDRPARQDHRNGAGAHSNGGDRRDDRDHNGRGARPGQGRDERAAGSPRSERGGGDRPSRPQRGDGERPARTERGGDTAHVPAFLKKETGARPARHRDERGQSGGRTFR